MFVTKHSISSLLIMVQITSATTYTLLDDSVSMTLRCLDRGRGLSCRQRWPHSVEVVCENAFRLIFTRAAMTPNGQNYSETLIAH